MAERSLAFALIIIVISSMIMPLLSLPLVLSQSALSPDSYEPDNSIEQAKEALLGDVQNRTIYPAGDVDYVYFYVEQWSFVIIETAPVEGYDGGDTILILEDSHGYLIKSDDDSGTGRFSKITVFLPRGKYYIQVRGRGTFAYQLYIYGIPKSPEVVYSVDDPKNDDHGPGSYVYPIDSENFPKGAFDMTKFEVYYAQDFIGFRVTFQTLGPNIYNLSYGFSLQNVYIVIDAREGEGDTSLGDGPRVSLAEEDAWDILIRVNGNSCDVTFYESPYAEVTAAVWSEGSSINVALKVKDIPEDYMKSFPSWKYQVLVGGYDPNEESLWRDVDVYPGFWVFGGADLSAHSAGVAPKVIDMLAPPWASQELELSSYNVSKGEYATIYCVGPSRSPPAVHGLIMEKSGLTVNLSWDGYYWAEKYFVDVYLPDNSKFISKETKESSISIDLAPGADYRISVRAYSNGYYSSPSEVNVSVPLDEAPSVKVSPGSTGATIEIMFPKYPTVGSYEYKVATDKELKNVVSSGTSKSEKITISGLSPESTYYVAARIISKYGYSSPWNITEFSTGALVLSKPKPVIQEKSYTYIAVKWDLVKYADEYEVIAVDSSGKKVFDATTKQTSVVITGLAPGEVYIIQVRAINSTYNYTSDFGAVQGMTEYLESPEIAFIEYPERGRAYIAWTNVKGADAYEIQIARDKAFTTIVYDNFTSIAELNITLSSGTYYVRVRAYSSAESVYSAWSKAAEINIPRASIIEIIRANIIYIGASAGGVVALFIVLRILKKRRAKALKEKALRQMRRK